VRTTKFLQVDTFVERFHEFRDIRHVQGADVWKLERKRVHALGEMCISSYGVSPRLYSAHLASPQIHSVVENALCFVAEIARGPAQKCEVAAQIFELCAYDATDFWRERGEVHRRLLHAVTGSLGFLSYRG
jgi:hypothetical protein